MGPWLVSQDFPGGGKSLVGPPRPKAQGNCARGVCVCSAARAPQNSPAQVLGPDSRAQTLLPCWLPIKEIKLKNELQQGQEAKAGTKLWATPELIWDFTTPFRLSGGNN